MLKSIGWVIPQSWRCPHQSHLPLLWANLLVLWNSIDSSLFMVLEEMMDRVGTSKQIHYRKYSPVRVCRPQEVKPQLTLFWTILEPIFNAPISPIHRLCTIKKWANRPIVQMNSCPDHTKLSIQFQPWKYLRLYSEIDVEPPLFTLLQP